MTITGNENTVIKLYKLCKKNDIANLKFKPRTSLNELFKTDFEIFEESLEKIL